MCLRYLRCFGINISNVDMIGILFEVLAGIHRLWRAVVVFVLLNMSTNIIDTANDIDNTTRPETTPVTTTKSIAFNITTESPLIPHVNVTAVTGKY